MSSEHCKTHYEGEHSALHPVDGDLIQMAALVGNSIDLVMTIVAPFPLHKTDKARQFSEFDGPP